MTDRKRHGIVASLVGCALAAVAAQAEAQTKSAVLTRFEADAGAGAIERLGHFPHADPAAPKGGEARFAAIGTFDSFHPFVLPGVPAGSVIGLTFDTLMVPGGDDAETRHCLVCASVELPPDRGWIEFTLRPEARFHDGSPVAPEDVIWTIEVLRRLGHPLYRAAYAAIVRAEKTGEDRVRLSFQDGAGRDAALLAADTPVLSRAWWTMRDFRRATLEPPLGSGPYRVEAFEPGRYIVLRRVVGYWAAGLPVSRGRYNFDLVRFDYYRDETVALEAFKAGEFDLRFEAEPRLWAAGYDGPALAQGLIRKTEAPEDRVSGMAGLVINTRRVPFQDRRVRAALAYAFDFEWMNRVLFHGAYARTRSYFNNGELSARGLPEPAELALLGPWRDRLPDEVFAREYAPPRTGGSGDWRANRREAMRLLREAGFRIEDQALVDRLGAPVAFEILLDAPQLERIALVFAENLRRLGIAASVRTVDAAQYQQRLNAYDFDITASLLGQSDSPGLEQRAYWSSAEADVPGGRNLPGIRDPAIDAIIERVIAAPDRAALIAATRAIDRMLQWGHYVVPFWHAKVDRVAYWDRFGRPAATPRSGVDTTYWWVDMARDATLRARRSQAPR